jgi:DNA-binding winged helix-turn-helix (wHTH) protein
MSWHFEDFELDTQLFELRHGDQRIPMEPQVFEVLSLLVENRGRLVTKDELMEKVWGDKYISEAALGSRVMSARKAIGDSGREQRLIRTIHGRGYRFVGEVEESSPLTTPGVAAPVPSSQLAVGRDRELAVLRESFNDARAGMRRTVFLSGDGGIGKTTLIESFRNEIAGTNALVGVGHAHPGGVEGPGSQFG